MNSDPFEIGQLSRSRIFLISEPRPPDKKMMPGSCFFRYQPSSSLLTVSIFTSKRLQPLKRVLLFLWDFWRWRLSARHKNTAGSLLGTTAVRRAMALLSFGDAVQASP